MEAKEKAKELVEKYYKLTDVNWGIRQQKQCALIAVDELINATQYKSHMKYAHNECETVEYWIEVKNEIEKL